ncbi:MAG TPA: GNAT family N-acetyltransferase [Caulobacterales bacterium]|nr:GNAT family N-acetyltransferase [Caulobacterales bacterium]
MLCRELNSADLGEYRELHRLSLTHAAGAFADTVALDAARDDADVAAMLDRGEAWGAFQDGRLIAKCVMDAMPYPAFAHVRWVHGVYVHPDSRGGGAAMRLLRAAMIAHRASGALRFQLWVNAENAPAIGVYKRLGFQEIGRAPQGIRIGERYVDDVLMGLGAEEAGAPSLDARPPPT